jgi:hypothetical protein
MHYEAIRVALWDVRAQWEGGVRQLTAIQSAFEQPESEAGRLIPDVSALEKNLEALRHVNVTVRTLLEEADRILKG